jgi:chromosomal replication initiator protein
MARRLVDGSAPTSNPVLIHGPAGSGKTAIAEAFCEDLTAYDVIVCRRPAQTLVPCVGSEDADALVEALECDLLVIEDLQHLPSWAEEPLVQLLDERLSGAAALLLTASSGPQALTHRGRPFGGRLTSRLAAGLVVELAPWQAASRLCFLREMAQRRGLQLPEEMLAWLAEHLTAGGRQLEGALTQIDALQRLFAQPLQPAELQAHFASEIETQRPSVARIVEHVGDYFAAAPRELRSARRSRRVVLPRQVSMYLARRLTPLSLQQIGAFFGGRDHATVRHACRKVEASLSTDAALAVAVRRLTAELA